MRPCIASLVVTIAWFPANSGTVPAAENAAFSHARIRDDMPLDAVKWSEFVPAAAVLTPVLSSELGGVMKLTGPMVCAASAVASADRLIYDETEMLLYCEARFAKRDVTLIEGDHYVTVSMIPYYARLNRKSDHFKIWLPVY